MRTSEWDALRKRNQLERAINALFMWGLFGLCVFVCWAVVFAVVGNYWPEFKPHFAEAAAVIALASTSLMMAYDASRAKRIVDHGGKS